MAVYIDPGTVPLIAIPKDMNMLYNALIIIYMNNLHKFYSNMYNVDNIPPCTTNYMYHYRVVEICMATCTRYHHVEVITDAYFPKTIRDWNALPPNIPSSDTLEIFKSQMCADSGSILITDVHCF